MNFVLNLLELLIMPFKMVTLFCNKSTYLSSDKFALMINKRNIYNK